MFTTNFSFLDKDIELTTNSQGLFNYLIRRYSFFIIKEKKYIANKIKMIVEPPDSKRFGKFLIEFFLYIQSLLNHDNYVMFHGAAVARDGKAKVFLGPSGSGKTTIGLFAGRKGYQLLSDEICLINRKSLTIAFFQIGPMRINPFTIRLLKEHDLSIAKICAVSKGRVHPIQNRELEIKDLTKIGILFAEREYPIEKIYFLRKDRTPLLRVLPSLCYYQKFRNPSETMRDLKFLYYLSDRCPCRIVPPFNLSTTKERKLSYDRIMKLLDLA